MSKPFFIFAAIAIVIGGAAYILFVYLPSRNAPKEGDACKTTDGKDGKIISGACVANATTPAPPPVVQPGTFTVPLGSRSTLVAAGDLTAGSTADLVSTITNSPLKTTQGEAPKAGIHYQTQFNQNCFQYVWYKGNFYVYHGAAVDQSTGVKTCYYRFSKNVLPASASIYNGLQPNVSCANFKMYIGNIEYVYKDQTKTGTFYFCNYTKK